MAQIQYPENKRWGSLLWDKLVEIIDAINFLQPKYKIFVALLTQAGTENPTVTVLENTIGDIDFAYVDAGYYEVNSDGLFTVGKTDIQIGQPGTAPAGVNKGIAGSLYYDDSSTFAISTLKQQTIEGSSSLIHANGILYNTRIEIRVYNT